jgi:hypothetical protein
MNELIERMSGVAQSTPSLGKLIDHFLDWIEDLSDLMAPAAIDGLICSEVQTPMLLD